MFFLVHVNYLAVLFGAVAAMAIGFVWYGPLFGKQWMKLIGMTKEGMEKGKKKMPSKMGAMFVSALIMAYVLAHFEWYAAPGSLTLFIALKTAVWSWLGFVATSMFSQFLFAAKEKPISLYLIDSGYYLATLLAMGLLFGILK